MHPIKWGIIVTFVVGMMLSSVQPVAARQPAGPPPTESVLSPYWSPAVRQWESIILEHANYRGLDPDLVAALIWKESRGVASARGPAGAVGLMMLMPKEAGFSWRPTIQELQAPWTNLFWGTRALATVIYQANGDLYNALAAYNGGWDQIHLRGPNRYAHDILDHYARAVAMRSGLSPEGHWVATITTVDQETQRVLTVLGPQRPLTRYSARPVAAQIPDATADGPPTAVAYLPIDGRSWGPRVGIWIQMDGRVIHPWDRPDASSEPPIIYPASQAIWAPPIEQMQSIL